MVTWSISNPGLVYVEAGSVVLVARVDQLTERLECSQRTPNGFRADRAEYVRIMLNDLDRVTLVVV